MIDTPNFLFIVLELAEGGELFDKVRCELLSVLLTGNKEKNLFFIFSQIIEKTKLNENEAKLHFFQV